MSTQVESAKGTPHAALAVWRIAVLAGLALLAPALLSARLAEGPWGTAVLGITLGGVSAFAAWRTPELDWRIPIGIYLGMTVALIGQAVLDESLRDVSHNLLPFEIGFLWFLGALPVSCGALLGRWLRRYRVPRANGHRAG